MIAKHTTTRARLNDEDYRSITIKRDGEISKKYNFEKIVLVMQQMFAEKNTNFSNKRKENAA